MNFTHGLWKPPSSKYLCVCMNICGLNMNIGRNGGSRQKYETILTRAEKRGCQVLSQFCCCHSKTSFLHLQFVDFCVAINFGKRKKKKHTIWRKLREKKRLLFLFFSSLSYYKLQKNYNTLFFFFSLFFFPFKSVTSFPRSFFSSHKAFPNYFLFIIHKYL